MKPVPAAVATVHFWTSSDPGDVEQWDPDAEPERFADGRGHSVLEPYARLRANGLPVSVGPVVPPGTDTVVASMADVVMWRGGPRPLATTRFLRSVRGVRRTVIVRNEHPLFVPTPSFVTDQLIPTATAKPARNPLGSPTAEWIAPLPQRGMRQRSPARRGLIGTVALKANPDNVPGWLTEQRFVDALHRLGMTLDIDTTADRWPDFAEVDVALCVRVPMPRHDGPGLARRPPTKLVNAWSAGAIPLVLPRWGISKSRVMASM
jgi:hypothetical protein